MSRRDGACWRHPAQRAAGVCADCLKERLSALSPSAETTPHRSSYSDRTSAFGFVVVDRKKFCAASSNAGGSGDYGLARGGQQQLVSPLQLSDAYLRRSKSWSHWEGTSAEAGLASAAAAYARNQCGGFAARKSDAAVLDDWTRQRFFSIFAKDQQQKRKDAPFGGSNSRSTPQQHLRYDYLAKSASRNAASTWLQATPSKVEQNLNNNNNNNNNTSTSSTILENGGLEEQAFDSVAAAAAAKKSPRKASSSSAWWSSLLQQLAFRKPKSRAEAAAALEKKKSTKSGGGSSSSLTGFFNRTGTRKKEEHVKKTSSWTTGKHGFKSDFVNWRHPHKQQAVESLSWISSPLRLFKHGGGSGGGANKRSNLRNGSSAAGVPDEHHHQHHNQQCERLSCSDERSSWSIPSPTEMKRLNHQTATTPASYTAYYRDYGAWSLSSSPVPNNRWGNMSGSRGKQQPWESRDIPHPSSSPYHRAVGSSTWNFYLTPLRPVKGSTASSKHRY